MPDAGPTNAVALRVSDLCFAWAHGPFWQGWGQQFDGGLTLVIGGDGAGKTTLLRLLAAELQPTSGQLTVNQHEAWPQPAAYRQQVFWCNPASDQLDHLSGHAYLQHHRQHHAAWQDEACTDLLAHLELTEHLAKPLLGLSAGMRRKLRLAAALASGASLTLLDDPFAALDKRSGRQVMELLLDCSEATHRVFVAAMHEQPADLSVASVVWLP
jgi:ABC-type multidrug transport system ATPase subunit